MASGETICIYVPQHGVPPATLMALQGIRNIHPTLEFDAATEWAIYFEDVLPRNYAGGGITVNLHWLAASATSGDVVWGASFEAETTDLDADSFGSEQTATGTANGTSGIETVTAIANTDGAQIDSLAAGGAFRLKVARKAAAGGDTMAGNAQLVKVELKET